MGIAIAVGVANDLFLAAILAGFVARRAVAG